MIAACTGVDVRIVRLQPMRVAAVKAVGETPELEAWRRLRTWAEPEGLLDDTDENAIFGFQNPSAAPDRDHYGYEYWIRVNRPVEPAAGIEIKQFDGGLYAVTTARPSEVGHTWNDLFDWAREHGYSCRRTHELEQVRNPFSMDEPLRMDLYLPIQE